MTFNLRLGLVIVSLLLMIVVIKILKKGRIPIKYSFCFASMQMILQVLSLLPSLAKPIRLILGIFQIQ